MSTAERDSRIRLGLFLSILLILNVQSVIEDGRRGASRDLPSLEDDPGAGGKLARQSDPAEQPDPPLPDQPDQKGEFPSNSVEWGMDGPPQPGSEGYLEIWDITGSGTRKVVRLRPFGNGRSQAINFAGPSATIYVEPGAKLRVPIIPGAYEIVAISGASWNGRDFGEDTWAVSFGRRDVSRESITILAVGARDEVARPASRNEF